MTITHGSAVFCVSGIKKILPQRALTWKRDQEDADKENESLNIQLMSQLKLAFVHFAVICLVVVATQMKDTMKDELLDLVFESEFIFICLSFGLFDGDNDVTKISPVQSARFITFLLVKRRAEARTLYELIRLLQKRENVCCGIFAAEEFVQLFHPSVGDKSHRKLVLFCF